MKYLIVSTFEIDGHSSADCIIVDNKDLKDRWIESLRWDSVEEKMNPITHEATDDDGRTTLYGESDMGNWSITIIPFKTYKEILNKEVYTRTG